MKTTGMVRPVDNVGRLVLPKEIRRQYGLLGDDANVEIFVDEEMIILRKYTPACIFCGSLDGIVEHMGNKVCKGCIGTLCHTACGKPCGECGE